MWCGGKRRQRRRRKVVYISMELCMRERCDLLTVDVLCVPRTCTISVYINIYRFIYEPCASGRGMKGWLDENVCVGAV